MLKLCLWLLLLFMPSEQKPSESLPPITTRIVGGTATCIKNAPFMVSLEDNGNHICGGSIVNSHQVITAAHCTENRQAFTMTIRAGSTIRQSGGQVVRIKRIHQNQNFTHEFLSCDVSILDLKRKLKIGETISPITLAAAGQTFAPGTDAVTFGWGTLHENSVKLPKKLQRVALKIVSRETCQKGYPPGIVSGTMLCAGSEEAGKDTCDGDSGGPLVVGGILAGITSFGLNGCGRAGSSGIYADVGALRYYTDQFVRN